ncbi:H-X9-DG-CTERM domain-containing protein [Singulisphaera sp. PoT]
MGFGRTLTVEGSFPFSTSRHRGGSNLVFRDGSVR